ncbi:MAG: hypothetical protein TU35_003980 [Thermoproteus sp. AZ2]|jgi:hypothetical protein|uniref:Uncharacterized protein n=1 Tax=Thermoproteus sp. AZ2 TaxID=1609232 RepID=A0ACC6V077_9CREN|nr:MAG: hypothetical protein TU35_09125 [Thermoproteus sp. AZ2]
MSSITKEAGKPVEATSSEIAEAKRFIIAGDEGRHYLVAAAGAKLLYAYSVEYELSKYEVLSEAGLKCKVCGAPIAKLYVYRDAYGECEKGHLNHLGIVVAWLRPGEGLEE